MPWINEPMLTSEQKQQMYIESMEKAMDYGEKVVMSMIDMYRKVIAEKHVAFAEEGLRGSESASALYDSLVHTFIVFDQMATEEAEQATDELIKSVQ
jgi:hypothetical protein